MNNKIDVTKLNRSGRRDLAKRERSKMAVGTSFILLKNHLGKIVAPLKVGYVEVKKKSRAGVEYSYYKKEIMLANSINE